MHLKQNVSHYLNDYYHNQVHFCNGLSRLGKPWLTVDIFYNKKDF